MKKKKRFGSKFTQALDFHLLKVITQQMMLLCCTARNHRKSWLYICNNSCTARAFKMLEKFLESRNYSKKDRFLVGGNEGFNLRGSMFSGSCLAAYLL